MFDFLYLGIAIIYVFLVGFVLRRGLQSSAHKYFLFFLVSLLLWHLSLYLYLFIPLGEWLLFAGRFNYAMGPLFTFGLLGFFSHFPSRSFRNDKLEKGFWLWTLFLASISLLTPLIDKNEHYVEGVGPVVELGEWYLLYMVHMFAMPLLTLILGLRKYFRLKRLSKTRFGISFWIFVPTMLAFVITNGILPLYEIYWQFYYSPIFLIPIALSSAYAMYRYRFFDLSYQALQTLRQLLLLTSMLIIGILTYYGSQSLIPEQTITSLTLSLILSCLTTRSLERFLPEFTSSSFRSFRQQLQIFQANIYSINSYEQLQHQIENSFVLELHISKAQLYLVRQRKISLDIPLYKPDPLTAYLEKHQLPILVREELHMSADQKFLPIFREHQASLILPLYLNKKVLGLLIIGQKNDQNQYTQEEITEILQARQILEISFINLLMKSDLTDEKNLMKQLINDKTKKLRQQNSKIKKILQQQSDFIAVTAHEFRTPLNIALLQLNDTLDSFDHSSQVLEDMKVLESSLDKLKRLTHDLFEIQQYDLNKVELNPQTTDIGSFVEEIGEEFQDILKETSLHLQVYNTLKTKHLISVDPAKFRQVLHNLLSNAQKFSPQNSSIELQLRVDDQQVIIEVIDHGHGIDENDKKRLFTKFQTGKKSNNIGIGMGLYLCKKIIDLHRGKIEITDTLGGGSTFRIILPS